MVVVPAAGRITGTAVEQQVVQQHIVPAKTASVMVDNSGATRTVGAVRVARSAGAGCLPCALFLVERKRDVPVHVFVEILLHFLRRPSDQLRFIRRRSAPRSRSPGTRDQERVRQQRDPQRSRQDADWLPFWSKKLGCERLLWRRVLCGGRVRPCCFLFFCQNRFPPYEKTILFVHDWNEQKLQRAFVYIQPAFHRFEFSVAHDQVVHML